MSRKEMVEKLEGEKLEEEMLDEEEILLEKLEKLRDEEEEIRDVIVERAREIIDDMAEENVGGEVRKLAKRLVKLVDEELSDTVKYAGRLYKEKLKLGVEPEDAQREKISFIKETVVDIAKVAITKAVIILVKELAKEIAKQIGREDLARELTKEIAIELSIDLNKPLTDLYYDDDEDE